VGRRSREEEGLCLATGRLKFEETLPEKSQRLLQHKPMSGQEERMGVTSCRSRTIYRNKILVKARFSQGCKRIEGIDRVRTIRPRWPRKRGNEFGRQLKEGKPPGSQRASRVKGRKVPLTGGSKRRDKRGKEDTDECVPFRSEDYKKPPCR